MSTIEYIMLVVEIISGILAVSAFVGPKVINTVIKGIGRVDAWIANFLAGQEPGLLAQYSREINESLAK